MCGATLGAKPAILLAVALVSLAFKYDGFVKAVRGPYRFMRRRNFSSPVAITHAFDGVKQVRNVTHHELRLEH